MTVTRENGRLELIFPAIDSEASKAIASLHDGFVRLGLPEDRLSDVKIALAEAINNVVEHAYSGLPPGKVQIVADLDKDHLEVRITDAGNPLPGLRVPDGIPASVDTDLGDLPEGGFGWFLIRRLSDRVQYHRLQGRNLLKLEFRFCAPASESQ